MRGNDFRKAEYDRRPLPRQSSGRRSREDAYPGKPHRDANAGKQRWNDDSNRNHTRKRVVVKKPTKRD
jgi:hypothetical protein